VPITLTDTYGLENLGAVHARSERRNWYGIHSGRHGVESATALDVTQRAAGPNFSVDVAPGQCWVPGATAAQGLWPLYLETATNLPNPTPADGTNPRIDYVIARVQDTEYSDATNSFTIDFVNGTPAASPSLPIPPARCIILAILNIPANLTAITNGHIVEARTLAGAPRRARGRVGQATFSGNAIGGGGFHIVSGSSLTFTTVAQRRYRVSALVRFQPVGTGSTFSFRFARDGAAFGVTQEHFIGATTLPQAIYPWETFVGDGSSHTYRLEGSHSAGSFVGAVLAGGYLMVEDIGGGSDINGALA
jgi:hypothetical protein